MSRQGSCRDQPARRLLVRGNPALQRRARAEPAGASSGRTLSLASPQKIASPPPPAGQLQLIPAASNHEWYPAPATHAFYRVEALDADCKEMHAPRPRGTLSVPMSTKAPNLRAQEFVTAASWSPRAPRPFSELRLAGSPGSHRGTGTGFVGTEDLTSLVTTPLTSWPTLKLLASANA